MIEDFLERRIADLELSNRLKNCLKLDGFETVGEIVKLTPAQFLRIPDLGKKSLNEMREVLSSMGLQLAGDTWSAFSQWRERPAAKTARHSASQIVTRLPLDRIADALERIADAMGGGRA